MVPWWPPELTAASKSALHATRKHCDSIVTPWRTELSGNYQKQLFSVELLYNHGRVLGSNLAQQFT